MNRNLKRALLLIGTVASLATTAAADDWVRFCEDPTSTTPPWSTDWGALARENDLFGAVLGVSGTVNYSKYCFPPSGVTLPMQGRLGFTIGTTGSTQDNLAGTPWDDQMGLTYGMQTGVSGNFSIAKLFVGDANGANIKSDYFGKAGLGNAWTGASDRYFYADYTSNGFFVALRVDVIGDTARCQWAFQNQQTTAATIGFWFGQWVVLNGPQGGHSADYVIAPGYKPNHIDTRYARNANPNAAFPELELPPYINFGMFQSEAYGLQVVLSPSSSIPDQTPADALDFGKNGWILGSMYASDGAMPDDLRQDTSVSFGDTAYIEKWNAQAVQPYTGTPYNFIATTNPGADTRVIVAYYKSTWSSVDYQKPYAVVLDAPPVIGTVQGQPNSFQNAPFFLTVDIDNTRGFSTVDQAVPLQAVAVTLSLPQGMSDANNPASQQITQYINSIPPKTVQRVTFQVAVDPTLYGSQQYQVSISPNPGVSKVLTGTVVVASQPYLRVNNTANLVSAPWQFSDSTWNTIIGANSGLVLDQDYQVFGWDALAQSYVLQTGPQRGFGSFVISNQNVGYVPLGGGPQQVNDIQTGAPQIICHPGWNLIANPYNYAIPIGQIVGVPLSDNQNSYTFQQLANQNIVSGFLAYWDTVTQGYKYTTTLSDNIQPNTGYWMFVQSDQDVVIDFPPVFQEFLPGLPDPGNQIPKTKLVRGTPAATAAWNLKLIAQANGAVDSQTSIGQTTTPVLVKNLSQYKPPIAPAKNAVWTSIPVQNGKKTVQLGRALTTQMVGTQTWNWQVYSAAAGPVNVSWPAIASVPNNVQLTLVDTATGARKNMRSNSNYSFIAKARTMHNFQVVVQTGATLPVITNETLKAGTNSLSAMYVLSVNANTTVTVTQGSKVIATLVNNRADNSGLSNLTWNYLDAANRPVKNGTYQLVVKSTPSGGATETKSVTFAVKR